MSKILPMLAGIGGLLGLMAACAPQGGPASGASAGADPQDPCGPQQIVFVSAGDLFGEPPRRFRPPTREELEAELARENAALERLQIAFDALVYCRWTEVRVIRAEAASGTLPAVEASRRLAWAQARFRRDIEQGGRVRENLAARSARIEAAVERVSPGTFAASRQRSQAGRAVASAPITLRLRPDTTSPIVAQLPAGTPATVRPVPGGFAFADAGPRARGYAQSSAFTVAPATPEAGADRLRTLAATNIARREAFTQSLRLAGQPEAAQGFETGS